MFLFELHNATILDRRRSEKNTQVEIVYIKHLLATQLLGLVLLEHARDESVYARASMVCQVRWIALRRTPPRQDTSARDLLTAIVVTSIAIVVN